jgi:AcrR family transcriptional regulator
VVVRTAARLVDSSADDVSLSRVAEELGVRTPSLYKHIPGLPALQRELALLGLHLLRERLMEAVAGRSADEAVYALTAAYRAFAHQHPGLYAASLRAPARDDAELQTASQRVVELLLRVLEAYGLEGDEALHAVRALRSAAHGFVSLEAAGGFGLSLDLDESYHRLIGMLVEGLQSDGLKRRQSLDSPTG